MTTPTAHPELGHQLRLFHMDGMLAWSCTCGVAEYEQDSEEAARERWAGHVGQETGQRPNPTTAPAEYV